MNPDASPSGATTSQTPAGPAPDLGPVDLRRAVFSPIFDFTLGRGLEIGPLSAPITDASTHDVHYVDVVDRDELVEHYGSDPSVDCDLIPELQYWLKGPDGFRTLGQAVAAGAPYDWVVASHVVEHVPDLIGWFAEISSVLVDGGCLVLVVPDRRFTFDILRPQTTTGQLLAAHARADVVPSTRAVFDHFRSLVTVDVTEAWKGRAPSPDARTHSLETVVDLVRQGAEGEYVDSHVWTFTPSSFVDQVDELGSMSAIDLTIADIVPTRRDQLEFYVLLERLTGDGDPAEREAQRRAGIARARECLPPEDVPTAVGELPRNGVPVEVMEAAEARWREETARLDHELHRLRVAHHEVLTSTRWRASGVLAAPVAFLRRRLRR